MDEDEETQQTSVENYTGVAIKVCVVLVSSVRWPSCCVNEYSWVGFV